MVSKEPDKLLTDIIDHNPNFYAKENAELCDRTPANMITVLMIRCLANDITKILKKVSYNVTLDKTFREPFNILHDVPIEMNSKNIEVQNVLYKGGCDRFSAVVLTGELAGLIVNPYPLSMTMETGMVPNRIWNDDLLETSIFDKPSFILNLEDTIARTQYGNENLVDGYLEVKKTLDQGYSELKRKYKYTSEAFFQLCQEVLDYEVASKMSYDDFYRTYEK